MEAMHSVAVENRFVYVIQETHALPEIDCFRALKHVLLSGKRLQLCNRFLSQHKRLLAWCLVIGISQALLVPYVPANIGHVAAFIGLVEIPALIAVSISLRYDMIWLLLHTYEFWYLTFLNVAFVLAGLVSYQDMRSIVLLPSALSFELLPLQDANFRALRFTIAVSCLAAAMHAGLVVIVNLHLIDQWTTVELIRYGSHAFVTDNVVSNYLVITTVVLLRNAYRKHRWIRDCAGGTTTTVRCIAYRCRVHLCFENDPRLIRIESSLNERKAQMRLVPSDQVFDSDKTILRRLVPSDRVRIFFTERRWCLVGLYSIGAAGLALTCADFILSTKAPNVNDTYEEHPLAPPPNGGLSKHILSVSSTILTGIFCGFFFSVYQQQLMKRLLTSFDFLLLATNIMVMHVSVADAFGWTSKCFALSSSWIWIMWVITIDALTPDLRQALGLRRQYLIGVLTIFILCVVLFTVELIFLQQLNLQDRSLFRVFTLGTTFHLHVIQFFFSCLLSLLPMCVRVLWRLYTGTHGELIMIQGAVEYDDVLLARRRQHHHVSRTSEETQRFSNSRILSWLNRPTKIQPARPEASVFQGKPG